MNDQYDSQAPASGVNILGVFVGVMVLLVLAVVLFPIFCKESIPARKSGCQPNLKQIGNSIKMYLADWDETYPTNRQGGKICAKIKLSAPGTGPDSKAWSFRNGGTSGGVNWVEGLYAYMEPIVERKDTSSVWKCPSAALSGKSKSAEVSYAFNRNLIEQPEKIIRSSGRLMMLSESACLLDAELKPSNKSNKDPKAVPKNAFSKAELHGNGSHILFADGHVKLFSAEAYFANGCEWDPKSKCWFNVGVKKTNSYHAIQITP